MRREGLLGLDEMSIDGSHVRALKKKRGDISVPRRSIGNALGPSVT